jgi:hypothetical protein
MCKVNKKYLKRKAGISWNSVKEKWFEEHAAVRVPIMF